MTEIDTSIVLARTAAKAAAEKLGENIVALDVSRQLALTDIFLMVSASNERQVGAIVDAVEEALLKDHGVKRIRREGQGASRWVLLDFNAIVVHVFHAEDREFYGIERLWNDSPTVDVSQAVAEGSGESGDAGAERPGGVSD